MPQGIPFLPVGGSIATLHIFLFYRIDKESKMKILIYTSLLIFLVILSLGCIGTPVEKKVLENITQLVIPQKELPDGWVGEGVFVEKSYQLFDATGVTYLKKGPDLIQLRLRVKVDTTVLFDDWIHKPVCEGWISAPYAPVIPCKNGTLTLEINRIPLKSLSIGQVSEGFLYISANYSDGTTNPFIGFGKISWKKHPLKSVEKTDEKGITYFFIDSRESEFLNVVEREYLSSGFSLPKKNVYSSFIIQEDPDKIIFNDVKAKLEQRTGKPIEEIIAYKEPEKEYSYETWVFNRKSVGVLKIKEFGEDGRLQAVKYASQLGDYFFELDVSRTSPVKVNGDPIDNSGVLEDESGQHLFRKIISHALEYELVVD